MMGACNTTLLYHYYYGVLAAQQTHRNKPKKLKSIFQYFKFQTKSFVQKILQKKITSSFCLFKMAQKWNKMFYSGTPASDKRNDNRSEGAIWAIFQRFIFVRNAFTASNQKQHKMEYNDILSIKRTVKM